LTSSVWHGEQKQPAVQEPFVVFLARFAENSGLETAFILLPTVALAR
jgi:hypothetical protein